MNPKHTLLKLTFLFTSILVVSCSKKEDTVIPPSSAKNVTAFGFLKAHNPTLDKDYPGTVANNTITIVLPHGLTLNDLKANFTLSEGAKAKVGSSIQTSNVSTNDFTNPVTYTIVAADNSTANFTVTVTREGAAPNVTINTTTAFHLWSANYLHTDISAIVGSGGYWGDQFAAQAFYDFDKDGDKDLITASINFDSNTGIDMHFYRNNGGVFTRDQSIFGGNVPKFVHARQIILGDFDNNGWMDVVVGAHGYDKQPFPGEQQKILLNNNGIFNTHPLPLPTVNGEFTFNHSVTAGDVDNDGDVDLFFTNSMRLAASGIFLLNNGNGTFTYDESVFPGNEIKHKPTFTSSLYDLDADGYLDLVIAGHDKDQNVTAEQGQKPTILWGNHSGKYSTSRMTILPVVANYGVSNAIAFMDYDKDGKQDIVIGKTGDGTSLQFYQGYYLQLLKNNGGRQFIDASSSIQNNATTTGSWVVWWLPHDVDGDGDLDLTTADKWYNLQWKNNGGTFVKY